MLAPKRTNLYLQQEVCSVWQDKNTNVLSKIFRTIQQRRRENFLLSSLNYFGQGKTEEGVARVRFCHTRRAEFFTLQFCQIQLDKKPYFTHIYQPKIRVTLTHMAGHLTPKIGDLFPILWEDN